MPNFRSFSDISEIPISKHLHLPLERLLLQHGHDLVVKQTRLGTACAVGKEWVSGSYKPYVAKSQSGIERRRLLEMLNRCFKNHFSA